jgi:hypothetical protein
MSTALGDGVVDRPLGEKIRLGGEIVRTYLVVRRRLRAEGLPRTLAMLREPLAEGLTPADGSALRLGRAVQRTLAVIPADTRCLSQSLVLLGLLARRRIAATLVIGVEDAGGAFGAHAWVEIAGRPLLPPGTDAGKRFVEL